MPTKIKSNSVGNFTNTKNVIMILMSESIKWKTILPVKLHYEHHWCYQDLVLLLVVEVYQHQILTFDSNL